MSNDNELKIQKIITYAVAGSVCFIFLALTTCTMHMNTYNPGEIKANIAKQNVNIELAKQKHSETMERLKIVEKLIRDQKVDPVAARCAVEGWSEETSDVCLALVKKNIEEVLVINE